MMGVKLIFNLFFFAKRSNSYVTVWSTLSIFPNLLNNDFNIESYRVPKQRLARRVSLSVLLC